MSPRRAAWIIHFPAAYQSCARNDLTGGNAGVDKPTHRTEGNGNWKTAILVLVGPAVLPCHGRGCGNPVSGVVMPFVGGVFILKGWLGNKWLLFRYSIGMCAGWADNMAAHTVPGFAQRDFCQGCHNPGKGQEPGSRTGDPGREQGPLVAPSAAPQLPLSEARIPESCRESCARYPREGGRRRALAAEGRHGCRQTPAHAAARCALPAQEIGRPARTTSTSQRLWIPWNQTWSATAAAASHAAAITIRSQRPLFQSLSECLP